MGIQSPSEDDLNQEQLNILINSHPGMQKLGDDLQIIDKAFNAVKINDPKRMLALIQKGIKSVADIGALEPLVTELMFAPELSFIESLRRPPHE